MAALRAIINGPAHRGTYLSVIGIVAMLIGLLMLVLKFSDAAPVSDFFGPGMLVAWGWLLIVPDLYRDVTVKGLCAFAITYVLIVAGIFNVLDPATDKLFMILPLYGGMGGLAWVAKRRDSESRTARLLGHAQSQALASDTLFVVAVVLTGLITAFTLTKRPVAGLADVAQHLFENQAGIPRWAGILKGIVSSIFGTFEAEYCICCIASLFWLASEKTTDEGFIPHRWASYGIQTVMTAVARRQLAADRPRTSGIHNTALPQRKQAPIPAHVLAPSNAPQWATPTTPNVKIPVAASPIPARAEAAPSPKTR